MCDFFPAFHPVSGFQRARQAVKLKDALERRKSDRRFPVFANYPALLRLCGYVSMSVGSKSALLSPRTFYGLSANLVQPDFKWTDVCHILCLLLTHIILYLCL